MFCKIRKGKDSYSIYICERYRENGKVVSNDKKIDTYGYHSLYEDFKEENINFNELPRLLGASLRARILRPYTIELYDDVEDKLLKLKKEYYPKYKEICRKIELDLKEEKKHIEDNYNKFKEQYKSLHYQELSAKYKEGYIAGQLSNIKFGSVNSLDIDNQEKTLLKEAFKLLSKKYHPDIGGNTETMAKINNLKEKIL
ncbi:hypothetical protein UMC2_15821 [[Clostridium] sordellii]|uniref:hypothetical protein n=1 Tax=Paraclostridium sordellii TaxID=1505 RepID=UPI0005444A42|nr:hypothetical protein [Paeniclostridium sordellii]CEK34626.1 hypothetical protein UMC2_15821 [[Clostridium] sordellii] [Paeniclostridium sordellii]